MAGNSSNSMVFPIEFDLKTAVTNATAEWDSKYAKKLEQAIAKKPINVKLQLDTRNLNNLDEVKKRLTELKLEPITPENRAVIKDLVKELTKLAKIMEKVSKFKGIELPELQRAKAAKYAQDAALAQERLRIAQERLTMAQQRAEQQSYKTGKSYLQQGSYIDRLIKRMVVYASFRQIGTFVRSVREITAEFELQRVSLGAILQDQAKADKLFSDIKAFALQSPASILDLTKYTKQLAAYKIGYEELFETTKKLTDVSVGLGVSMDRVVLAYGQTRATGYLRASEVRQFTEMGIPIVEELAKKLTEANGQLTTAADVMDLISKRGISFEMVKDVFNDMTSAGGIFYNMQEKQSETLYGMWAKLGDAASVMYDEIGNTGPVNDALKGIIGLMTDLMRNWQTVAGSLSTLGVAFGVYKLVGNINNRGEAAYNKKIVDATKRRIQAQQQLNAALQSGSIADAQAARAALQKASADEKAARAARENATRSNKFSAGLVSLGKSLASGALWTAAIAGITALGAALFGASSTLDRVKEKVSDIMNETSNLIRNSTANFIRLAERVAGKTVVDGSKDQKDALDELKRSYSSMIPTEELTIENLKRLRNGVDDASVAYNKLTDSIKAYYVEQQKQKGVNEIEQFYDADLKTYRDNLRDNFEQHGLDRADATRFFAEFDRIMAEGTDGLNKRYGEKLQELYKTMGSSFNYTTEVRNLAMKEALKRALGENNKKVDEMFRSLVYDVGNGNKEGWAYIYVKTFLEKVKETNAFVEGMTSIDDNSKKLHEMLDDIKKWNENLDVSLSSTEVGEDLDFAKEQKRIDVNIKKIADVIKNNTYFTEAFKAAGIQIDEGWFDLKHYLENGMSASRIDFDAIFKSLEGKNAPMLRLWVKEMQKQYNELIPKSETVAQLRAKMFEISETIDGLKMSDLKMYLWNGDGDIEQHLKNTKDQIEGLEKNLKMLRQTAITQLATQGVVDAQLNGQISKLEGTLKALEEYEKFLQKYVLNTNNNTNNGSTADPRLQSLQEIANKMAEINKEYEELLKKESQTKALADTQRLFKSSLDEMQRVADKYHFKLPAFDVPQTTKDVRKWYDAIINEIKRLNLKNADKILIELGFKSDKGEIDEKQKEIERTLKELAERISRTKTAKEFYDKILSTTGDIDLASKVSMSIYGDTGSGMQKQMADQIRKLVEPFNVEIPEAIISIDNRIDYLALEKFVKEKQKELGGIESNTYKELSKIAEDGQKNIAKSYEGYLKDLEKAKTYSDKRIELARYTANQIAEINKSTLPQEEKDRLTTEYREREAKEAAKLQYEEFKNSALYVKMFEDLDFASTSALTRMRTRLIELKKEWRNLSPTELKELQSRLEEIDQQLAARNPFKTLADTYKQWWDLYKSGRTKEGDEEKADQAERARVEAEKKMLADEKAYQALQEQADAASGVLKPALQQAANEAKKIANASKDAYDNAKDTADESAEQADVWKEMAESIDKLNESIDNYQSKINETLDSVKGMLEVFGASDTDMQFFDDVIGSLNMIVDAGQDASTATGAFMSGDYFTAATKGISAISGLVTGFSNLFSAGKVRRANKEIKRQQELLEQLEYTYSRLEASADKIFGTDYINNYRQQIANLEAQAKAYQKQADAERSKGKKADEEKIKEYENAYRDTMNEIADMQGQIAAQMLGSDLTSAARDFAKAWLDAYKEFGNTADAISEKFRDMIDNMVVESLLAKVMEKALKPAFDMIDNMGSQDFYSTSFWEEVIATAEQGAKDADQGAQAMMSFLEKAGLSMREMNDEYTGIQRETAGASEETMSNVAVIGNTLMYYVSPIPRIDENVAIMRRIMETGAAPTFSATSIDTTALWNRHLELQQGIYEHTRRSAEKCEAMAIHCKQIADDIHKVIAPRGSSATASVQVRM